MKNTNTRQKNRNQIQITLIIVMVFALPINIIAQQDLPSKNINVGQVSNWPVLKAYDSQHLKEIRMPIGGIGTGTVSLTGSGAFQDWEIMNRPAKGFNPGPKGRLKREPFFSIYVENTKGEKEIKLLEGPLLPGDYEGQEGSTHGNHGLPRFSSATFSSAYPFGQVHLEDSKLPLEVTIGAFNPLIPGNADESGIPMAVITFEVKNISLEALNVSVNGNLQNFIGFDGLKGRAIKNKNIYTESDGVKGIRFISKGVDKDSPQWGTMALVTLSPGEVSHRTSWNNIRWGDAILDFWDDFNDDGMLENRETADDSPIASIAVKQSIASGETKTFKYLLTWHFPNRKAGAGWEEDSNATVGNYYSNLYRDAWDVVKKEVPRLGLLENKTLNFVNSFLNSDLPKPIKEAALFNLSNLRTQLVFRIESGQLFGFEGNFSNSGSGYGSCTHVWNYEHTLPFLFGDLARTMREVEFAYATTDEGLMCFRVGLPLNENAQKVKLAAADGQMGTIIKVYRDWQFSGDDEMLIQLYPKIKKAMEFAWIKGGWDADMDGVMEGAQHNTMDVEYFGPNPQMGFMYLGALKAQVIMAKRVDDTIFAKKCSRLYENGSNWIDANLFNGEYYEQDIRPPMLKENVAPSLMIGMGSASLSSPDYQLGKGVLVDQLIGQVLAHTSGLGYLGNSENSKATHRAILKYNHRESLQDHANFMRTYALGDEAALLMAGYPNGRPKKPFPYFSEVMTGFEYTAAIGMIYDGLTEEGLRCIQNIRNRYDGLKRNPFNEAEYGNHYARAMAAWGAVVAYTGFQYSGVDKTMSFNSREGRYFWSNGSAWGMCSIMKKGNDYHVDFSVLHGEIELAKFSLGESLTKEFKRNLIVKENENAEIKLTK